MRKKKKKKGAKATDGSIGIQGTGLMGSTLRSAVMRRVPRKMSRSRNASHHPMWSKLAMRADTASGGIAVGAIAVYEVVTCEVGWVIVMVMRAPSFRGEEVTEGTAKMRVLVLASLCSNGADSCN